MSLARDDYELVSSIMVCIKYCISHVHLIVCFHGDVQLVTQASTEAENVVQFCYKGDWRFVCKNSDWDTQEANLVCQQMGHGG